MSYLQNFGQALLGRKLRRALNSKASAVGPMIARFFAHQPVWSERDFERLAREGYQQNAVVARSVQMVADSVANIPIIAYRGKGKDRVEVEDHPVLDLIRRPNPEQDGVALLKAFVSFYKITGNAYLERTAEDDPKKIEIYAWRPDRVTVIPGEDGLVEAYEYSSGGARRRIGVDSVSGVRPVLHMKTFNPTNDWYGQSPLDACSWAIDISNEASAWNLGILKNSGAPSGAFVYKGSEAAGNTLTDEQIANLRRQLDEQVQGSRNAGRPMVLDGGMEWQQMALDPERMQYIEGAHRAAREIAFALGVPPMMLGIPGDNTYSNYQEARQAFYQDTVIPLARRVVAALSHWFARQLGEDVTLDINTDGLEALAGMRREMWQGLQAVSFLSVNEKREALGYGNVPGGDDIYIGAGQLPISMAGEITGGSASADPPPKGKPPPKAKGGVPYLAGTVHQRTDLP